MLVKTKTKTKAKAKSITKFRIRVRTKNHSAEDLRDKLYVTFHNKPVIVRLGSLTPIEDISSRPDVIEINKCEAIEISRDKLLMKEAFTANQVKTADWYTSNKTGTFLGNNQNNTIQELNTLPYPILSKSRLGQGGVGNTLHKDKASLEKWLVGKNLSNYIFEKYYNYAREYRIHVTKTEAFLAWRKLRKTDAKDRWYFNSDNCVWVGEENALFDKPANWEDIKNECIKAAKAVGLDICAIDVRVQSSKNEEEQTRKTCDFIILECNSAPSLGLKGSEAYYNQIMKLINK